MYFPNKNNFFHGIMFHHFHDDKLHKRGQGSMNKDDFYKIIKFIGRENILDSQEFFNRLKEKKLKSKNVCFTFDDSVRCQYDIALPVLEDLKIKSFFFVYSSILKGEPNMLEIYRYFRMNFFNNVNDFYNQFFKKLDKNLSLFFKEKEKMINKRKSQYPYYSINDIKFRVVRRELLSNDEYRDVMFQMFDEKKFIPDNYYEILFMYKNHLRQIKKLGHLIGLHSHSHPTLIEALSLEEQFNEYNTNIITISELLNIDKKDIKSVAHPNGSYNQDTLKIIKDLGIEIGFVDNMDISKEKNMKKINNSFLEIAREDCSTITLMMNNGKNKDFNNHS